MKCPFCRQSKTEVFNSRTTRFSSQTWRRRRCLSCGKPFTTYEATDLSFLRVLNSSGKPQVYSRAKLFTGIYLAFQDLPEPPETIDAVTDTIEAKLLDLQTPTIPPDQITDIVLSTLKHFSPAAFVRYLTAHSHIKSNAELARALRKY